MALLLRELLIKRKVKEKPSEFPRNRCYSLVFPLASCLINNSFPQRNTII